MNTENLRLIEPCRQLSAQLIAMGREFEEAHDARYPYSEGALVEYFDEVAHFSKADRLPPDRVRMTTFWLMRGDDLIGGSRLRHDLIPILYDDGGHIGYDVRPSERGRGYGHAVLGLTLHEARKLDLDRVLLTCEIDNDASRRVIEQAGGSPFERSISHVSGAEMLRFWIAL